jgi:hypothetical protein
VPGPARRRAGSASAPAERPLAETWKPGGAYAGPVPPAGLLGPTGTWQLKTRYTNGYAMKDSITFGVPLHYAVPRTLLDCNTAYPGDTRDLDPGLYVIPYAINIKNLTPQQSPAGFPEMSASYEKLRDDGSGQNTDTVSTQVTGMSGSFQTWADGACTLNVSVQLEAGGTTALYGLIGPATPQDLSKMNIHLHWTLSTDGSDQSQPLHLLLLPQQAKAWLAAHGGSN